MNRKQPPWEEEKGGVQVLRLYKTDSHGDWPEDVNKTDLHPDWPRVLVLDLADKQFHKFDEDPLQFTLDHNLFPEQPIRWMSPCAKPPLGKVVPRAAEGSRWTVVIIHGRTSIATCAAIPQSIVPSRRGSRKG